MKLKHKIGIVVLTIFIGIQFYRPQKNVQKEVTINDFLVHEKAPKDIARLYTNACYDCHSDYTDYSWFNSIAPVSWYIDDNLQKGVFSLNFSNWTNMTWLDRKVMFSAIPFNINTNAMPEEEYVWLHPKAVLSDADKTKMVDWLIEAKTKFLTEEPSGNHHLIYKP